MVVPPRFVLVLPPAPEPFGWELATTAKGNLGAPRVAPIPHSPAKTA